MIEVRDVTKRYKGKNALEKVSFSADDGQVTGFVGPNGAGKSTTIRIISGVEAPSSGVALVDGTPFASVKDPTNALGVYLGSEHLPSRLKGIQYIEYMCRLSGISIETARSILDDVGLADAANKRISSYSLGMKQRIGLAAALVGNPSNLVLDEPVKPHAFKNACFL